MKISVVIPCYHKKDAIEEMVAPVRAAPVRDLRFRFEPIFAKLELLSPSS